MFLRVSARRSDKVWKLLKARLVTVFDLIAFGIPAWRILNQKYDCFEESFPLTPSLNQIGTRHPTQSYITKPGYL